MTQAQKDKAIIEAQMKGGMGAVRKLKEEWRKEAAKKRQATQRGEKPSTSRGSDTDTAVSRTPENISKGQKFFSGVVAIAPLGKVIRLLNSAGQVVKRIENNPTNLKLARDAVGAKPKPAGPPAVSGKPTNKSIPWRAKSKPKKPAPKKPDPIAKKPTPKKPGVKVRPVRAMVPPVTISKPKPAKSPTLPSSAGFDTDEFSEEREAYEGLYDKSVKSKKDKTEGGRFKHYDSKIARDRDFMYRTEKDPDYGIAAPKDEEEISGGFTGGPVKKLKKSTASKSKSKRKTSSTKKRKGFGGKGQGAALRGF